MRRGLRSILIAGALARAVAQPHAAHADELPPAPPAAAAREVLDASGPRHAQRHGADVVVADPYGLPEAGWFFAARAGATLTTGLDEGQGEYRAERTGVEARRITRLSSRVALTLEAGAERLHYGFTRPEGLVGGSGELGGSATGFKVGGGLTWSLSASFGLTAGVQLRGHAADGADLDDGLTPAVVGAVRLRLFGSTSVFLGAMLSQPPEGDLYLVPVLGMGGGGDDQGTSRWSAEARGPGATLWYRLSARWALGLSAGYERRDIRLAPDDVLPDGVLREQRVPVGLELGWRGGRDMTLSVTAGASVYTRLTLLDDDGDQVRRVLTDLAPYVGLEFSLRL